MIGCRAATLLAVVCAAVLLSRGAAFAQTDGVPTAAPGTVAEAPAPGNPTAPPESPTLAPPAPPNLVSTPTPLDTETVAARSPTPPPTPPRSATPTAAAAAAASPPAPTAIPLPRNLLPLAAGAAIALVSMWLGARIAGVRERTDRRRARRTQATAMLLELRRVDAVLRRVVALDNAAALPTLDHPIMEAALRDLTLFRTETAARIAQFHGALRGIQHEIDDYRDNPLRWAGRLGELNQLIRSRSVAACRAVPDLLRALEREGGAPPPHLSEPAAGVAPGTADLPPPPFGAADGDDWTL